MSTVTAYQYGPDPQQTLTATYFTGRSAAPWVMTIHGGSWNGGSQANCQSAVNLFYGHGWQAFNIGYRMGAGVTFDMQRDDLALARDWIKARATQFGINPGRGTIYGFSAGGHLAAILGNLGGMAAVVSVSGVLQPQRFPEAVAAGNLDGEVNYVARREVEMVGCPYEVNTGTDCAAAWKRFEPQHGLVAGVTPPTYLMAGADDPYWCDDAATSYNYWLGAAGVVPRKLTIVPGYGHTDQVLFGAYDRTQAMLQWVGAFQ